MPSLLMCESFLLMLVIDFSLVNSTVLDKYLDSYVNVFYCLLCQNRSHTENLLDFMMGMT